MCGKCNEPRPGGVVATGVLAGGESPDAVVQPIRATIEPGFDAKVSIRIVPGRDILTTPPRPACQPRGDRPFVLRPIPYTPDLITKLTEANTGVTAWLAKDEANAKAFLDDPVTALAEAGVELTRAEAKAVSRSHAVLKEDAVLPPGAQISTLQVVAVKRGKVGDRKPSDSTDRPNNPDRPTDKPTHTPTGKPGADRGCGC